jgi:hypothetical protein
MFKRPGLWTLVIVELFTYILVCRQEHDPLTIPKASTFHEPSAMSSVGCMASSMESYSTDYDSEVHLEFMDGRVNVI